MPSAKTNTRSEIHVKVSEKQVNVAEKEVRAAEIQEITAEKHEMGREKQEQSEQKTAIHDNIGLLSSATFYLQQQLITCSAAR